MHERADGEEKEMEKPYFPMFVDISGKKVLVVGGGRIALRRVKTLLMFGPEILVTAPRLEEELIELERRGRIRICQREYCPEDICGADIVLAATDDRELNRNIWKICREQEIPVNTADDKSLCDFYFPSVIMTEDVVIGINSGGTDPGKVKETRRRLTKYMNES